MKPGCYTAIVTPFSGNAAEVDYKGLEKLVDFQIANGITGILAVGTTGESPTLSWEEHNRVVQTVARKTKGRCLCIAGTGSNNTAETLAATKHAAATQVDAVLLVDPYYNGPSSLEIRKEYVSPVAAAFPDLQIIPYVIPGRTGAQLLPEDLAILKDTYPNVQTVKEATGSLDNMKRTRVCCGAEFTILSGDDGLTFVMMTDAQIKAAGVISVITNVAPKAVTDMVRLLLDGQTAEAQKLKTALDPLFELVTVKTMEQSPTGEVVCRARNPLGIKTLMAVLGMPGGACRRPLGKMSAQGLAKVVTTAQNMQRDNPQIFKPLAEFFDVDIDARLNDAALLEGLCYKRY
jgi:4-hydroxy-tetrahydrodipicolinate synthase